MKIYIHIKEMKAFSRKMFHFSPKIRNMKSFHVEKVSDTSVNVYFQRFDYNDYDFNLKLNFVTICRRLEQAFIMAGRKAIVNEKNCWKTGGDNLYVLGLKFRFEKSFYENFSGLENQCDLNLDQKLMISSNFYRAGEKSIDLSCTLFSNDQIIQYAQYKTVEVEKEKGIISNSESLIQRVNSVNSESEEFKQPLKFTKFEIPEIPNLEFEYRIPIIDCDSNMHCNLHGHFRALFETLVVYKDVLKSKNIENYNEVNELESYFNKELDGNEKVVVKVYFDDSSAKSLKAIILNSKNEVANYLNVKYFI